MAISALLVLMAFLQCIHCAQPQRVIGLQSNSGQSSMHRWPLSLNYWQKPSFTGELYFTAILFCHRCQISSYLLLRVCPLRTLFCPCMQHLSN